MRLSISCYLELTLYKTDMYFLQPYAAKVMIHLYNQSDDYTAKVMITALLYELQSDDSCQLISVITEM